MFSLSKLKEVIAENIIIKKLDFVIILKPCFYISRIMEILEATLALSALSQETRLLAFKKLVEYGRTGINAGDLAKELNVPANTLSFHLSQLENCGLISSKRHGRNIIYCFSREKMDSLIGFLNENCCSKENGTCAEGGVKC